MNLDPDLVWPTCYMTFSTCLTIQNPMQFLNDRVIIPKPGDQINKTKGPKNMALGPKIEKTK